MHPSIARAKRLLAHRETSEAEHEEWLIDRARREQAGVHDWRLPEAEPVKPAPEPATPQAVGMSVEVQKAWDDWERSHLYNYFESVGVDFVTAVIEDERARTAKEIEQLRDELAQVRAELALMRAANVSPIGQRGRHAA